LFGFDRDEEYIFVLEFIPVSGYTIKMKCKECGGKIRLAFG
jgi:rRNA maturation protein Nop10